MKRHYDAIVIGAGAMGSGAAYHLSKRGLSTLLLEQFALDHRLGSSYGHSRIIRYSYDSPQYVDLMRDTYPLWFALEEELGESLYMRTGGIDFGPADDETLQATIAAVKASGISHELLSLDEAHSRFPQFRFGAGFQVLYQPDSGFVRASKAVLGHLKLARALGTVIKENIEARKIHISADSVEVETSDGSFSASQLIVTAGAWAKTLLQQTGLELPLTPLRCQLNFMAPADLHLHQAERCPVWIAHFRSVIGRSVYGIASHDGAGFKIAHHGGPAFEHPSGISRQPEPNDVEALRPFMRAHIPGIAEAPVQESRICLYTQTPDEHFVVDSHPEFQHVVIGAGFSGHGFKFSAIIGKMLADIALDGSTPHNDELFKIARFLV